MIDSLMIDSTLYEDVIEVDAVLDSLPDTLYFAKDVGIIQRKKSNGEIWILTDYFINQ